MMMMLKFAANVSMMFTELPTIAQRVLGAKKAGFEAIEIAVPYGEKKEDIAEALRETGVKCVMINSWPGPGHLGLAADPDKKAEFKDKLELSLEYAKALQCPRMHILAGCVNSKYSLQQADDTYVENMRYAADRLSKGLRSEKCYEACTSAGRKSISENITILAEFVNSIYTVPGYFLDSPEKAIQLIERVDRGDQVKFQLDLFHLQLARGDLTNNIKRYLPKTGHLQVAQVPERGEPGSPGEINYTYIFDLLTRQNYSGWIGLEYKPSCKTEDSLSLLKELKYLSVGAS